MTKTCIKCQKEKPDAEFYKSRTGKNGLFTYCKLCDKKRSLVYYHSSPERRIKHLARNKDLRERNKTAAINRYGGVCVCCGESESMFLTIDHIDNNGADHRRETNYQAQKICRWLKANNYPDGFQVLCMNCNFGKHINGGTCPHQEIILCQKK